MAFQPGDIAKCIDISGDGEDSSLALGESYRVYDSFPGKTKPRIVVITPLGYTECEADRFELVRERADFTATVDCGCAVTFFANSGYITSRMQCCEQHNKFDQTAVRDELLENCKLIRDHELNTASP